MEQMRNLDLMDEMWEEVFKFLNFEKLKECRLVCHRWKSLISGSLSFRKMVVLHIHDRSLDGIKEYISQSVTLVKYRKLKISKIEYQNYNRLKDLKDVISSIGANVIECTLHYYVEELDNLHLLLPNLKNLIVYNTDMNLCVFTKVKMLCLHSTTKEQFMQLTKKPLPNLEALLLFDIFGKETIVCRFLITSASTLKHLTLFVDSELFSNELFGEIWPRMNKLESITLINFDGFPDALIYILESLSPNSPLKKIKIFNQLGGDDWSIIFDIISNKWPHTLQILYLCGAYHLYALKNFPHSLSEIEYYDSEIIKSTFWNGQAVVELLRSRSASDIVLINPYLKISPVPNLVYLQMTERFSTMTNDLLISIFRYLTNLRMLILRGSRQVTDLGFIGYEQEPYALSRLHALNYLEIYDFPHITDAALISTFKFANLRFLRLRRMNGITAECFQSIVKHCPAIENLEIYSCALVDKKKVANVAKDLKRLCRFTYV